MKERARDYGRLPLPKDPNASEENRTSRPAAQSAQKGPHHGAPLTTGEKSIRNRSNQTGAAYHSVDTRRMP